jgi:hypothetical protein
MSLTVDQAKEMHNAFVNRREAWPNETEQTSFLVVVLNYGDHLTGVSCIGGEWTGTKGEIPVSNGIPLCPIGHPLVESANQWRLSLERESSVFTIEG